MHIFSVIAGFVTKWLTENASKIPFFLATVTINTALAGIYIAFLGSISWLLIFAYKKIDFFINYVNSNVINSDVFIISWLSRVLASVDFWNALHDSFNLFIPAFSTIFLILAGKYAITGLKELRNSLLSLVISKI